ncbi:hypothetical protein Sjap_021368 [Stephania japonica]|uniref:Uncharacterized protein n=1 Tax=Stephania japonica TaxID=461633 RepID=A0AAP0ELU7_9MAGN
MNGYSKIRLVGGTNKSKSIDFSDLYSPPKTPKSVTPVAKQAPTDDSRSAHDLFSVEEESSVVGERFGVILRRNCSVSAVSSKRFSKIESNDNNIDNNNNNNNNNIESNNNKQRSVVIQSAVKRAFSMRRSCSVSEGYCRIYDQTVMTSPTNDDVVDDGGHDDDLMNIHARSDVRKTKRGKKILRACKRLLGFH